MGVAQKTMFTISDQLAKFFGISGAPIEHNQNKLFLKIRHKRPRTKNRNNSLVFFHLNVTHWQAQDNVTDLNITPQLESERIRNL